MACHSAKAFFVAFLPDVISTSCFTDCTQCYRATRDDSLIMVAGKRLAGKQATDLKSYLLTLGILCEGYVSNSFLDGVVGAAEKYFRVQISDSYKTDSNGYIICSPEKTKITNADLRPLTLNASGE